MALLTLASATGSPGVTTTALGLALAWPGDVLLVDADRAPAQAVEAGYLRGVEIAGRGMAGLADAHRRHGDLAEEVGLQCVDLLPAGGTPDAVERLFLPGFASAGAPLPFAPVWSPLAQALRRRGDQGRDVVVDAGRIGPDGLPPALVAESELVLVCVRSNLRALAALRLHLPTLVQQVDALGSGVELGLLVIGAGRPYGAAEISRQFDLPVRQEVAWDPRAAAVLSDGEAAPHGFSTGALRRSHRAAAQSLAEFVQHRAELVAARPTTAWGA